MSGILGGGGSSSKSKPVDLTPLPFRNLQGEVAGLSRRLLAPGAIPLDGLDEVAGLSPGEGAALDALSPFSAGSFRDAGTGAANDQIAQTLSGQFLSPDSNPALQGVIDASLRPIFQAAELQNLNNKALFSRAGQRVQDSSPFAAVQQQANSDLVKTVADTTSSIVNQNFQQERDRQVQAVALQQQQANAQFQRQVTNLQAQALPRLIADLGITRGNEEFNRRIQLLQGILGISGDIASPVIGNESRSKSVNVSIGGGGNSVD